MEEKKKSKRGLLILFIILLVVVTAAFVGTYASYITSREVSDGAAVAKFGLNIPATVNLFSDSYTNVKADVDGKKIIAPGTSGQYKFEVNGTAEVAYKVDADVALTYSEEWDDYEPLEFSVDGNTWTDFAQFRINLSTALESAVMPPNSTYENTQTIYWRWPFSTSPANDIKDSAAGILAAAGTPGDVEMNIKVIAAQID